MFKVSDDSKTSTQTVSLRRVFENLLPPKLQKKFNGSLQRGNLSQPLK
jgi:hypothetical protein